MLPIELLGARTHNLKGIDLTLRAGELCAITGPSGAGKSSLAMDTLYAEGQRRFVESFTPYARQFLERLDRPPVQKLDPIAAGVAVDRRSPIKSSRSNVSTMADLEPYLSALFAREATPVCVTCGVLAERTDATAAAARVTASEGRGVATIVYSVRIDGTEAYLDARETLLRDGYRRVLIGDKAEDLDELPPSAVLVDGPGSLKVIVDRVRLSKAERPRIAAALEQAWSRSNAAAVHVEGREAIAVVSGLTCPGCAKTFAPPSPAMFSYQSPVGACGTCRGFGRTMGIDWAKVIPNENLSLSQRAIRAWNGKTSQYERRVLKHFCEAKSIPMDRPWRELTAAQREHVLAGQGTWSKGAYPGVRAWFEWLETRTYKMHVRVMLSRYRSYDLCKDCGGKRLSPASSAYQIDGLDLGSWHTLEIAEARARLERVKTTTGQGGVARAEILSRLSYLERVGLGYLTLDRQARTLSGGEAQRVSLTAALGTALVGTLFVLDEPTVGLHPTDVPPLVEAMRELARRGNVVLVVEHDPQVIAACDRVIELGPESGEKGGAVVYDGSVHDLSKRKDTATSRALAPKPAVAREERSTVGALQVRGARGHNLRGIDVSIPLHSVVAVTGASGSGKTSLVRDVIYRTIARHTGETGVEAPLPCVALDGLSLVRAVSLVDQSPLGRTSRGNAATYSGAWNRIRALFAQSVDALARGLEPGHFSFNVAGGRCDACNGEGAEVVEMQFLADVRLTCASCGGKRFKPEVLEVRHRDRTIGDVLGMTVAEALTFFAGDPTIVRSLGPLVKLGLGYLGLGQPLSTLSGGEAQRAKIARALVTESKKGRLFVFDEPSAGLHDDEVGFVCGAFDALVAAGSSVLVVEHDAGVIAQADWIIELGPGGGSAGGQVVAQGTPSQIARGKSRTGEALRAREKGKYAPALSSPFREIISGGIEIQSAREHNLKNISLTIPRGEIVVVTGPSGSGKSTLAFDVVFAEGQRRFMETLTPYARQFLPTLPRPDVDRVVGVPPAIALEQRTARSGATSTVATVTEIAQYLRLLYAKLADATCPTCGHEVDSITPDEAFDKIRKERGALLAPAVRARKGTYLDVFSAAARSGVEHAIADGVLVSTDKPPRLKKTHEHTIDLVMFEGRMADVPREVFQRALTFGHGAVKVRRGEVTSDANEILVSTTRVCRRCDVSVPELDPRWFSFNTAQGQCPACLGTGRADPEDATNTASCEACEGSRLAALPRAQRLAGKRYHEVTNMSVRDAHAWAAGLRFKGSRALIADAPQKELVRRLSFVDEVGLDYLSLDRDARTLSGGEMQRLRLAAQLGSGLTGALYVLDEPTIGLHPRDTARLLSNLRKLADTGSTVLMVEHDADTIRAADTLIDLGPSGGRGGGKVIAMGPPSKVLAEPSSPTGRALRDETSIATSRVCLGPAPEAIVLHEARAHNLAVPRVEFPVGRCTVVAGVSGSGKSTLTSRVLYPAVRKALGLEAETPGKHKSVVVPKSVGRAIAVDQSPIGRTSRSVPATFLGIFDEIRRLYAATPDAKTRGYKPNRFSFNTGAGGRCSGCDGQGATSHEMSFLPDITTPCEACGGARFEPQTLSVRYNGLNIADVLDLSAEEAASFFKSHSKIARLLDLVCDLGIGYLKLGQGSHTLSGGEAQRLKLATELAAQVRTKPTLYVLDEPTTGLHWSDVARLIQVLDKLVKRGDTVVVIEHHPGVIATADWIVELGPEGGAGGGTVIAEGTPASVAKLNTPTGLVLRDIHRRAKQAKKAESARPEAAP